MTGQTSRPRGFHVRVSLGIRAGNIGCLRLYGEDERGVLDPEFLPCGTPAIVCSLVSVIVSNSSRLARTLLVVQRERR